MLLLVREYVILFYNGVFDKGSSPTFRTHYDTQFFWFRFCVQGIAVVGGCLAVLTALLPLLLKGGEEAFEEMKEQDKDKWGKNNSDTLKKRR